MRWPDSLISDLAARRAVLFIGAGISMNSLGQDGKTRPKSWVGFLEAGTKKIGNGNTKLVKQIKELISRNDLLTACEVIKNKLGEESFANLMLDEFQKPGFRHAGIHETLWSLDARITITPNIDTIYDTLVADRGNNTVTVKTYKDSDVAQAIRRRAPLLIKSHGTIGSPNALIFTRSDYAKARNEHRTFYELLYSLLSTHSFLFVGCGLEDPDIRYLLEDYKYRNSYTQTHFFTIPKDQYMSEVRDVYSSSLNLNFIEYSSEDHHQQLKDGLTDLAMRVELSRQEMSASSSW